MARDGLRAALYEEHARLAERLVMHGLTDAEQRRLGTVRNVLDFWERIASIAHAVAQWAPARRAAARLAIVPTSGADNTDQKKRDESEPSDRQ